MPVPISIDALSPNAAENYPVGTEPVFPNLDNYLRAHAAFIAQLRDRLDSEGLPLAAVMWWGGARSVISARFKPLDGQILVRADFPALWTFISGGGYPMVSDAEWTSAPLKRASFSSGDGATTFRMPDLNGVQANSIGAATVRGDGARSAGAHGLLQDSQNLSHGHTSSVSQDGAHTHTVSDPGHSHSVGIPYKPNGVGAGPVAMLDGWNPISGSQNFGTSGAGTGISVNGVGEHSHTVSIEASGGDEARMKSATGAWVMRVK